MSTEVKTEKPTWNFPSARKTPTSYDNPASLEWIFDVPNGKILAGFTLDIKCTTTGAGMNLVKLSQLIQKFRAFDVTPEGQKLVLDIDQYTLDLVPIVTHWAKHKDDYSDESLGGSVSDSLVVRDDTNVATGAALYGFWKIHAPLPVSRQVVFRIDTYAGPAVFGAGQTGGNPQFSIVPVFASAGKKKQYTLYAKRLAAVLRASFRGVEVGAFAVDAEWTTVQNGINLGRDLTPEQMYAIQSNIGNSMLLWANDPGLAVDGRLETFEDPLAEASTYVLANKFDGQAPVDISFNTAKDLKAVVMSEATPDLIEVR